ncbi:hypothetical protein HCN44_006224 [Aphidius gifuensis]|uniref:Uncharacterized protein n=1 Tax=Aphidius gifuensis TaxID=684658 RepID=A0A835CQR5_APHGI|nr:hypothetical protein HCN44_006224 [Aphidius gifuensis]
MIQNFKEWLDDKIIVQQLVKLLTLTNVNERHTNSSELFANIIKLSRDNKLSIVDRIEPVSLSEENVFLLLDTILAEPQTESSIVRRIQVLLVLLGQETTSESFWLASCYRYSTSALRRLVAELADKKLSEKTKTLDDKGLWHEIVNIDPEASLGKRFGLSLTTDGASVSIQCRKNVINKNNPNIVTI